MLEKPDIQDQTLIAALWEAFGLAAAHIAFLPLGVDTNAAVYRVVADDETPYFLKLRGGVFDEMSVALPKYLADQGVAQIISPLPAKTGQLWSSLGAFKLILYPFVEGRDGYGISFSDRHWREFGAALRRIHSADLPAALLSRIQQETYTPRWRERVISFLELTDGAVFDDPVAAEVAALLRDKREQVRDLVGRATRLAQALQAQPPDQVVCHSDVHAGNILVDAGDHLYIVDWDNPIRAPKERDLMFAGGGQGFRGHTPQEEEALFYQGYGQTRVDPIALSYYRYERIVQDIAAFCEQLLLSDEGSEDREQSFRYLRSNFLPDGAIAIAYMSDTA